MTTEISTMDGCISCEEQSVDKDHYCGFSCGDQIKKAEEICNEIKAFSQYNPEYSLVMLGKVMEVIYKTRTELIRMQTGVEIDRQWEEIKKTHP
jgi:hypothetical protein